MDVAQSEQQVLEWYDSLFSRRVDLIGDYAGSELFLVEGDSLLLHAFSDPAINFQSGFQLLHAVYTVEKLLQNLVSRRCNFHLVFFDENEGLCVPANTDHRLVPKYSLARAACIRHLQQNLPPDSGIVLRQFPGFAHADFESYLNQSGIFFVMCHDGAIPSLRQYHQQFPIVSGVKDTPGTGFNSNQSIGSSDSGGPVASLSHHRIIMSRFRRMISWFISYRYNVALINELQFVDTKAMTVVLEFSRKELHHVIHVEDGGVVTASKNWESRLPAKVVSAFQGDIPYTDRDVITVAALLIAEETKRIPEYHLAPFLLHTAAAQHLPLANRRLSPRLGNTDAQNTILALSEVIALLLRDESFVDLLNNSRLCCEVADLLDGTLFATCVHTKYFRTVLLKTSHIKKKFDFLSAIISKVSGKEIPALLDDDVDSCPPTINSIPPNVLEQPVLPFSNTIFDEHLRPVHLRVEELSASHAQLEQSKIFKELSHWHNHRKTVSQKGVPTQEGWFARRRRDRFMAEMRDYAASLTNAAGNALDPETIVVDHALKKQSAAQSRETLGYKSKQAGKGALPRSGPRPAKEKLKSGRAAALEAAAALKATKTQFKTDVIIKYWQNKLAQFEDDSDLESRYINTRAFLDALSGDDAKAIGPEVELYAISVLLQIWIQNCKTKSGASAMEIAATIWNSFLRLEKVQEGLTPTIIKNLAFIAKSLGFPVIKYEPNSLDRALSFEIPTHSVSRSKLSSDSDIDLKTTLTCHAFQLEHCGPYFDRDIDSSVDPRVPFNPDAWQRKVLDAIDDGKSLFVVAPTSAGKTFISFYAMKKILQANDDDVVVYVAPTKALVNQIAAEIQARFSKSFTQPGRSVWGIHTRDYRINNPTGCQVLVTVPHILQIMLLAPAHAVKNTSWSYRIKRIIFDEVHCIGQADDGLIWEQLLLQAPCPIIALSATVGNPQEFSDWLSSTQEANGHQLVTVQHTSRYSDLRKFIYRPPKSLCFAGLPRSVRVQTPGLDRTKAFDLIHPVASLVNASRGMPDDLALEPRDCLHLWMSMVRHQTSSHPLPPTLDPERALPQVIRKVDTLRWEADLKVVLRQWIADVESPFEEVRKELSKTIRPDIRHDSVSTKHVCDTKCKARPVQPDSLTSLVLPLLVDLHLKDALSAIIFNYERTECEKIAKKVQQEVEYKEQVWKETNEGWKKKIEQYHGWLKVQEAAEAKTKTPKKSTGKRGKAGEDEGEDRELVSKTERAREAGSADASKWAAFDPDAPVDGFHFADNKRLATSKLRDYQRQLHDRGITGWLVQALGRGIGVHHAGMNRKYRQVVEILFRKGFLRVVIATGTLALGINMPCKTVVFAGDSVFLTALNFRQCAGRAGRRGFDVLGNVVFLGIPQEKAFRLLSSRLPHLTGHFPITTSLVLRLATLLHESHTSQFAVHTIRSILSQPRLYLGSPDSKMAVLHHLRFSIEYLRRQCLLSHSGAPLNFAGCVSHLYYSENASWGFHALLKGGYFHTLCRNINTDPDQVCLTMMLVLAHIFGRQLCKRSDAEFVKSVVKRSSSIVFLPSLPKPAERLLREHNDETLAIFRTYVKTYADQHLHKADNRLPLTRLRMGSEQSELLPNISLAPTTVRSPFVALSGHGDDFKSISELCQTVRAGVFLEDAVVPYLPIYPHETDSPLNAYLYDFYKHGDITSLKNANKIRPSDVWFLLNDFSLVLATIVTSLTNFMKLTPNSEVDMIDVRGGGDAFEDQQDDETIENQEARDRAANEKAGKGLFDREEGSNNPVPDNWDDTTASSTAKTRVVAEREGSDSGNGSDLLDVLKAFEVLKERFDEKFKKIWA